MLAAADILVSPVDNTQETFGLSLLEAMAAGLPVVASRFDGYKDLVEDGVDGFLIDSYASPIDPMDEWFDLLDPNIAQLFQSQGVAIDTGQLAERLLELIGDEALRAKMAAAGRAKVDREYPVEPGDRPLRSDVGSSRRRRRRAPASCRPPSPATRSTSDRDRSFPITRRTRFEPGQRVIGHDRRRSTTRRTTRPAWCSGPRCSRPSSPGRRDGASLEELVASADAPRAHAWYAVTWLLKYGLLRLA